MKRLLVTNDDGFGSPALAPLLHALRPLGELRSLVPDRERSWIGKAITRFDDVRVEQRQLEGLEVHASSGTPADCANLGVHSVFREPPDLVVSGINIGLNHGEAFLFGSGTLGATFESAIARVPTVAFSLGPYPQDAGWHDRARAPESRALWERAAGVAAQIVESLLVHGLPTGVDVLNVNFPEAVCEDTPRVITRVAPLRYGGLFREKEPGLYTHDFPGLEHDDDVAGSDHEALERGHVSIAPLRVEASAALEGSLRGALERAPAAKRAPTPKG